MLASSRQDSTTEQYKVINLPNKNPQNSFAKQTRQNGQIQIYQSAYRGSYFTILRDSLRNAALGRKVLLVQLMKGGVNQGLVNPVKLCGNLEWLRSANSFDHYNNQDIENNPEIFKEVKSATIELWDFCKKQLLSGEQDQIILDEIFLALELGIIQEDDLMTTLNNRFITGDVILTGTKIPKNFLLIADQVTELRS